MNEKVVVMFAGANGSGKSTRIGININNLPSHYICPDNLLDMSIENEIERYINAMECAEQLREQAILKGDSLTFETVFSTEEKVAFLENCKRRGYYIRSIYMATKNPRINIKRIRERVKNNGHNVPSKKVVSRYYKSMNFLSKIIDLSDEVQVYDNSYDSPFCVFIKFDGKMVLLNKEKREEWVKRYIENRLSGDIWHDLSVSESSIFDQE